MFLNTKSGQYAVLMGLAGAIRRLTRIEDSVHALASYVGDRAVSTSVDQFDAETGPGVGDREALLVLAVEFEAAAEQLRYRARELRGMRGIGARHARRRDVSRETSAQEGEGPDTDREPVVNPE